MPVFPLEVKIPHTVPTTCSEGVSLVLAHCANYRISASVSTHSVRTVDMSVPTLERGPCVPVPEHTVVSETNRGVPDCQNVRTVPREETAGYAARVRP